MLPTTNARMATDVITYLLFGAIALSVPMSIPRAPGLAKPQIANVVMLMLRAYEIKIESKKCTYVVFLFLSCNYYFQFSTFDVIAQTLISHKLVDD